MSADRPLEITRETTRIMLVGDVRTRADCELLKTHVTAVIKAIDSEKPELIIDVTYAGYLDSTALATFVTIARKCMDVGIALVLDGVSEELDLVLQTTHLDQVLGRRGARVRPT